MFQALFNSLSGLFSFSKALDTVSNNVANMNTPGFRGSDSFFENVGSDQGTSLTGTGVRTNAGGLVRTGNDTDLALQGGGYFILRDSNNNLFYTRAGQFIFDDNGILIDTVTNYQVMAADAAGNLSAINQSTYLTLDPTASSNVTMTGNIAPGTTDTSGVYQPAAPYTVPGGVQVFDAKGNQHALTVTFTDKTDPTNNFYTYQVDVTDENGNDVSSIAGIPQTIEFDKTLGAPEASFNTVALSLSYGGQPQTVTLNFGTPGVPSGGTTSQAFSLTSVSGQADGNKSLPLLAKSFDADGKLQFTYSSTQKKTGPQLALAAFPSDSALEMIGGRLIAGSSVDHRVIGHAGQGVFGSIAGGNLEGSNVDLTQEFADMIIIQRGYQASSRVMTVSNQMLEELYNSAQGGG